MTGPADDAVAEVHNWLRRCTASPAQAEELTVEVFRRHHEAPPPCVATAPTLTRLRFLAVQSVLQVRGVL